jgi:hypothetical protein
MVMGYAIQGVCVMGPWEACWGERSSLVLRSLSTYRYFESNPSREESFVRFLGAAVRPCIMLRWNLGMRTIQW